MTSAIDATKPANTAAFTADMRANFAAAKSEIEAFGSVADGSGDALVAVKLNATGSVARTQHDKNEDTVSVKDFGAVGDGVTDDSAAFTAAAAYMKAQASWVVGGKAGACYVPPGVYRITKSIDCTANNAVGHGYSFYGRNELNTLINTHLTEAYPVFDFCGNGFTRFSGISMRQQSGCLATCGVLYGYVGSDTVGMNGMMSDILIIMLTCPGIVNTTDQFIYDTVQSVGTYGCVTGAGDALGITSKFVTILHTNDITRTVIRNCGFNGGVPLMLTGCGEYDIDFLYAAPTYSTSPAPVNAAIVIDFSYVNAGGQKVYINGLRTENQTASGTQDAMQAIAVLSRGTVQDTAIQILDVEGVFEVNNPSGANAGSSVLYSDTDSFINDLKIKGTTSSNAYPVLDLNGSTALSVSVGSIDLEMPLNSNIGSLAFKTDGMVKIAGQFALTTIASLSANNPVGEQRKGSGFGEAYRYVSDWALHPRANSLVANEVAAVTIPNVQNATYTGGSGAQDFITWSVPGGLYPQSGRASRHLCITVFGSTTAASTATVTYSDGTHTTVSDSITFASGKKYCMRVHCVIFNSTSLEMLVEMIQTDQTSYVWLANNASIAPSAAFTIKFAVTSAGSNPLNFFGILPGLLA